MVGRFLFLVGKTQNYSENLKSKKEKRSTLALKKYERCKSVQFQTLREYLCKMTTIS